jgi:hypothetical protein
MKTFQKKLLAITAIMGICFTLLSFSSPLGGEGFEIYINNKLVLQRFGKDMNTIKSLQVDQRYSNDQMTVKYYHCGQAGKSREIIIKDLQNKMLKEWKYIDASTAGMNCPVNDILNLQKKSNALNLYYSSKEIPDGRLLVTLTSEKSATVQP